MGSTRREKRNQPPRSTEDSEAILRRRRFLIESALAGVGLGLAATGQAIGAEAPQPCLSPLRPPQPCLSPPVPPPQPCLSPPPMEMQVRTLQDPGGAFTICVPGDWQTAPTSAGISAAAPNQQAGVQVAAVPRPAGTVEQAFHELRAGWARQVPGWTLLGWSLTRISGSLAIVCRAEGQPGGTAMVADYVLVDCGQSLIVCSAWCAKEAQARWQPALLGICVSLQVAPRRPPGPQPCLVPLPPAKQEPVPCLSVAPQP